MLCEKLNLPKETVRRKVLELEKDGVISRSKKKIIIDRKAFPFVKPENQIKFSSKYIYLVSRALNKEKLYSKKLEPQIIETIIKKRFSLCWRWFYRMQIPLIIGYQKFMQDLTTFHIWGTVTMNQVLNVSKHLETADDKPPLDHFTTSDILIKNLGANTGISAMSISDMTKIPRATIIRKCKYLIKNDLLKMNDKKDPKEVDESYRSGKQCEDRIRGSQGNPKSIDRHRHRSKIRRRWEKGVKRRIWVHMGRRTKS